MATTPSTPERGSRRSSRAVNVFLQRIDDLEFVWGPLDEPGPQTESSTERGFCPAGPMDQDMGRSESFDPDNVGEIADEGAGHRG